MNKAAIFALLAGWITLTGATFWHYEGRYAIPVHGTAQFVPDSAAKPYAEAGKLTLVVAWSPDCPCSTDEDGTLRQLQSQFGRRGLEITILLEDQHQPSALQKYAADGLAFPTTADADGAKARALGIWATPGCALIDRAGHICFRGSLHAGRFCHESKLAFAQFAIEDELSGHSPKVSKTPFYGCAVGTY